MLKEKSSGRRSRLKLFSTKTINFSKVKASHLKPKFEMLKVTGHFFICFGFIDFLQFSTTPFSIEKAIHHWYEQTDGRTFP
jgi:hypothetical protein